MEVVSFVVLSIRFVAVAVLVFPFIVLVGVNHAQQFQDPVHAGFAVYVLHGSAVPDMSFLA